MKASENLLFTVSFLSLCFCILHLKLLCYGVAEVSVVVSEGQEQPVSKVVEQYSLKVDLDVAVVSTAHDPGTADSLRQIASKIKVCSFSHFHLFFSPFIFQTKLHKN